MNHCAEQDYICALDSAQRLVRLHGRYSLTDTGDAFIWDARIWAEAELSIAAGSRAPRSDIYAAILAQVLRISQD